MKKKFLLLFLFLLAGFLFRQNIVFALSSVDVQIDQNFESKTTIENKTGVLVDGYVIQNFESEIVIEKNTDISVKETVTVNFSDPRHGIFRVIPITYSARGRTIRTKIEVLSITDAEGVAYPYETSQSGKSIRIKIGDPDVTVDGVNTYVITYKINKILQRFDGYDELYWNVTGSEWDTDILNAQIKVVSPYAAILKVDCFAGSFGGSDKFCKNSFSGNSAYFNSTTELGSDRDFTIVIGLDKPSSLVFPSRWEAGVQNFLDNWAYLPSVIPLVFMFVLWYKKGRDRRYLSDMIYYEPKDTKERDVRLFEKDNIPFVYHPITGLTPSEVGTIIDEKVDIADVIAEITELARRGYLSIRKIEKKKLIGSEVDFAFIKTEKTDNEEEKDKLNDYQSYLLGEIFQSSAISRSATAADKLLKGNDKGINEAKKHLVKNEHVLLSGLKNHFYEGLPDFKKKLYERMKTDKIFADNPEGTRIKWISIFIVLDIIFGVLLFNFYETTGNIGPVIALSIFSIPAFVFALSMPRRTAKGYSFFRQINGLRWYLSKGKWRHQEAEKKLFIEEILPLAISLGVVNQLTRDMKELGIAPPSYFSGSNAALFASDFSAFRETGSKNLLSSPKGSGSSSWSGGSGFSGGSSGGGFGGGGGGSW